MASYVPVFGLDLCSPTARLVVAQQRRLSVHVQRLENIVLEESGIETGNVQSSRLGESLRRAFQPLLHHIPHTAIVAIPDTQSYTLTIVLRKDAQSDPVEAIRWEAGQHIPFDLSELSLDWQILHTSPDGDIVQIVAAQKSVVETYCSALERAGITPAGVVPASVACLNVLKRPQEADLPRIVMLLDRSLTTIMGLAGERILITMTTECCTGASIHEILKKELSLDDAEAQKTLRLCGVDPTVSRGIVRKALASELERLKALVQQMQQFLEQELGRPCTNLEITGEEAQLKALDQELARLTGMQTKVAELAFTPVYHRRKDNALTPSTSLVALGAALYPQT